MVKRWLRRCLRTLAVLGLIGTVLVVTAGPAAALSDRTSCYDNGVSYHRVYVCVKITSSNLVYGYGFADTRYYNQGRVELWGLDGLGRWVQINARPLNPDGYGTTYAYSIISLADLYGMSRYGACIDLNEFSPPNGHIRRCAPSLPAFVSV
jgi:hypothetical protein